MTSRSALMELPQDLDYTLGLRIGDTRELRLQRGDITQNASDAIVNAANSELLPGGGVCGAIHRAGGAAMAEECRRILSQQGPLPPGQALATTAGRLPAKYVIHSVGPVWQGGHHGEAEVLSGAYRNALRIADDLGLQSIAFPAISTGIFNYPLEQAAGVAVASVLDALHAAKHLALVAIVLFDKATLDIFATAALAQRQPASGHPYMSWIAHD
jgi:O-acetyl-ADP-ribose deacetylase